MPDPFARLKGHDRLVAGIMSGTSLDGVDVVLARLRGSGRGMRMEVLATGHHAYPDALRGLVLANSAAETSSVVDISQLNARLAHEYARAVRSVASQAGMAPAEIDVIGCHGQTIQHVPGDLDVAGVPIRSTLQIGDPATLACLVGVPVVGDFRTPDMALGGQGAPLVPYFDFVAFSDERENRGLLNLGGIANLTVLPPGGAIGEVFAFDTGPANMVIDQLMARFFGTSYDEGGAVAARGEVSSVLLDELLQDAYFEQKPPKSTGRERFGDAFVARMAGRAEQLKLRAEDLVATAAMLTVESVARAYEHFGPSDDPLDRLIVAGGGGHNAFIMDGLRKRLAPAVVETTDAHGIDPDAKEALCFAVLAHEFLNGVPTSLPRVTGASRPAMLGKLCLPPPTTD
jgi:anhydro-N-acetylmuramic acid kinase